MRVSFLKLIVPLMMAVLISSCSLFDLDLSHGPNFPNDPTGPPTDSTSVDTSNVSTSLGGDWEIIFFNDSGSNETHHFNGFKFSFNDDGSLVAENGSVTYVGSWSITNDHHNGSDDHPHNGTEQEFNIDFSSPDSFEELSEDWDILTKTDNLIQLIHVSGGNGGTDFLTFQR